LVRETTSFSIAAYWPEPAGVVGVVVAGVGLGDRVGRGVRRGGPRRLGDVHDCGRGGHGGREGLRSGGRDEREAEGNRDERGGDGGGAAGEPGHSAFSFRR
jgi:hypothetical protein